MRIPAWFSPAYAPADVPLLARLDTTRVLLERLGLVELHAPEPIAPEALRGLHAQAYLDAFIEGREPLASRQGIRWSPAVRDATLAMLGGQLQAALHVLQRDGRIAMNIARGFHHAHPAAGSGFCAINGLALVAHAMPGRTIMVIDCDEHGGNGTEEFAALLPNLYATSVFGTRFGCRGGERSWAWLVTREQGLARYLRVLDEIAELATVIRPDIVIYQAGVDCHRDDPKSRLKLDTRELFRRDLAVFRAVRRLGIPTVFVVAGGYQDPARVARLNANTVRAARLAWGEDSAMSCAWSAPDSGSC